MKLIAQVFLPFLLMIPLHLSECFGQDTTNRIPDVFLNHLFIRLDPETYKQITGSEFLRSQFSSHEIRTTWASENTSWTGIYFYGDNTYIEFLAAESISEQGHSGIAFGVDKQGELEQVKSRLEKNIEADFSIYQARRKLEDSYIPWFRSCRRDDRLPDAVLNSWVMEYNPDFLKQWHPSAGQASLKNDVARNAILTRYATRQENIEDRISNYFRDVIGITVALDSIETRRFMLELEAYGYDISSEDSNKIARGPGLTVTVLPSSTGIRGITKIDISLKREKQGRARYEFGKTSVLEFIDNATAAWSFKPKTN